MNLTKLFEMQKVLDAKIVKQKGLEGVDLLDKKILALQVELGELANELPEVFKFWSNKKNDYEKALKEYVDCLHFILGVGNDLELNKINNTIMMGGNSVETQFKIINRHVAELAWEHDEPMNDPGHKLFVILCNFLRLGELLDFTWDQIEQAYMDKNQENHARQANGY